MFFFALNEFSYTAFSSLSPSFLLSLSIYLSLALFYAFHCLWLFDLTIFLRHLHSPNVILLLSLLLSHLLSPRSQCNRSIFRTCRKKISLSSPVSLHLRCSSAYRLFKKSHIITIHRPKPMVLLLFSLCCIGCYPIGCLLNRMRLFSC